MNRCSQWGGGPSRTKYYFARIAKERDQNADDLCNRVGAGADDVEQIAVVIKVSDDAIDLVVDVDELTLLLAIAQHVEASW